MRSLFASAALLATVASTASAQITVSSSAGNPDPFRTPATLAASGQTNILDFNNCGGSAPYSTSPLAAGITIAGGACKTSASSGNWAVPPLSLSEGGFYTTIAPYNVGIGSTITIDFSTWLSSSKVQSLSFYWGSIDSYQYLELLDRDGDVMKKVMGSSIGDPANGNQFLPGQNRRVNFAFGGDDQANFGKLRFVSTQAAFEFDDVAIDAVGGGTVVPEPATVTLLASALGVLGLFGARRKRNGNTQV